MSSRFDYEKIDVVEFLRGLGVQNVRDQGYEVSYSCPFDGHSREDANPSATMSKVTIVKNSGDEYPPTTFYCFGCGRAGTAVTFLSEYEGVSPLVSRKMLRERFGMSFREPEGSLVDEIFESLQKDKERYPLEFEQSEIPDEELEKRQLPWEYEETMKLPHGMSYMLLRGFREDVCKKFNIGYDVISGRISIPLFDERNRLVGFKGRAIRPDQQPRYLVLGGEDYGFDTCDVSLILFGLPQAMDTQAWIERRELNVVEGELNAIAMVQKGYPNTVGISGQYLSDRQAAILKDTCRRVNLIFDDLDKEANAARKLERYMAVYVAQQRDKDPADMSGEEIITMMNHLLYSYLV